MQGYVCSFLFSTDRSRVLLIRKRRPAWQAGRLNGIGGKIEAGETPQEAARREFREEADLDIPDFRQVLTLKGSDWIAHFLRAFGPIDSARAVTDEQVEIHPTRKLPQDTIPNLHWIIPLLLDDDPVLGHYTAQIHSEEGACARPVGSSDWVGEAGK